MPDPTPLRGQPARAWQALRRERLRCAALAALTLLCAPAGAARQTALAPESAQAAQIAQLWWGMLIAGSLILLAVMVLLATALRHGRGREPQPLSRRQSRNLVVFGGVVIPAAILIGFVVASALVGRAVSALPPDDALRIEVIGKRWWWEVHYLDSRQRLVATTANEIHVPVGRPVQFSLRSDNVIHSFWVPQLHGKLDLIPGQANTAWFTADEAGVYRGQCAEFCGTQHALMAFLVVAEQPEAFAQWLERQSAPAEEPQSDSAQQGKQVFLRSACIGCHAIRGTPARGDLGPDLTHVASRRTLAAGTLPNTSEHLDRWIADPQSVKPGNLMPVTPLENDERESLVRYLEILL